MNREEKVHILTELGKVLATLSDGQPAARIEHTSDGNAATTPAIRELAELIDNVHIYNAWFTPGSVRTALGNIAKWLQKDVLEKVLSRYPENTDTPKRVLLIMAGNIPLVGFHDFVCTFLAGHNAMVKLSSDDNQLMPAILKVMSELSPDVASAVELVEGKPSVFDALIATGSDNTAMHFDYYFRKYPKIIRRNRSSLAVLDGLESPEDLKLLGDDIFTHFGLGCRSVSQVWIPQNFELDRLFQAVLPHHDLIHHNKYANNYNYNKTVYLLNQEQLFDNGFLLMKEDERMHSPVAMLFYQRYSDFNDPQQFIAANKDKIQAVIGRGGIPFGKGQCPDFFDYADAVDTMEFLTAL